MPFREQHIEHFKTLEAIKIPRIMRVISWLLITTVTALVLFLIYTPWVQTTSGMGVITALNPNDREQNITAFVSGRIDQWYVQDGSEVKRGDPIVRIVDNDPQLLNRLRAEQEQIEVQLQAAQNGLETAQLDLDRTRELYENGLAARRDYEQTRIRVEDLRGRVAAASASLSRMNTNLSRQSAQIVEAPRDGVIQNIIGGDTATFVSPGAVLASFVPQDPVRVVEVFIAGRDIGLVNPGEEARIQFEGWPAVQFSGWPSVAVGTFAGTVTFIDPSAQPDGRFRVLISEDTTAEVPWPDPQFVRFGSTARAWILLETVPVGYEVWRQMNTFPPSLPDTQTRSEVEAGTSKAE